jgi:Asp-tRNA(Asn)/Glu-tRNA(Gln) amidotransferase A subunit family amidase
VKPWVASELSQPDRKIRIGIMKTDGVVTPVAPIQRALAAAADKLAQSPDFEVVEYEPIMGSEAWDIIVSQTAVSPTGRN